MHKSLKYAKMAVMHARQSRPSQIALANSRSSTLCLNLAAVVREGSTNAAGRGPWFVDWSDLQPKHRFACRLQKQV